MFSELLVSPCLALSLLDPPGGQRFDPTVFEPKS